MLADPDLAGMSGDGRIAVLVHDQQNSPERTFVCRDLSNGTETTYVVPFIMTSAPCTSTDGTRGIVHYTLANVAPDFATRGNLTPLDAPHNSSQYVVDVVTDDSVRFLSIDVRTSGAETPHLFAEQ